MNHKDFISSLADKCGMTIKETEQNVEDLLSVIGNVLTENDSISISGFGVMEVKKKMERVSVNPGNGQRMLVPPKLVVSYKPSTLLKNKLK